MSEDYAIGFARGEEAAWKGRGRPLPPAPDCIKSDVARGYWDARLPRNPTWARQRRLAPAKWDIEHERYMVGIREAA